MRPYFSIIIPTYNHAEFLRTAISDVISQTIDNWECIIIDNQSNDNTKDVVKSFNDSRLFLIEINNEGVIGKSRNIGIKHAAGKWIAFLDSDDRWYPERLEVLHKYIEKNNEPMVFSTNEKVINYVKNTTTINRYGPYGTNFYKKMLIYGNRLSTSATIVNREFLVIKNIEFSESQNHITVEDYDFWLKIAKEKVKFKFIPKVCGEYIVHGNNASSKIKLHFENQREMLFEHLSLYDVKLNKFYLKFLKKLINLRIDLAYGFTIFQSGKKILGFKILFLLFIFQPFLVLYYLFRFFYLKKR